MLGRISDPLSSEAPARIQLEKAPLVRVLAQVRFPRIIKISDESHIGDFQELLRSDYPFIEKEDGLTFDLSAEHGGLQVQPTKVVMWRLFDKKRRWRVSLGQTEISIEAVHYTSRSDFMERFGGILRAVSENLKPGPATRIGFRYVNRIVGEEELDSLPKLVQPELVGVLGSSFDISTVEQAISDARCRTTEGKLVARWGLLPANSSHEPQVMSPQAEPSWMLDIDSFCDNMSAEIAFDAEVLCEKTNELADRAYAFFRWSVTPAFLEKFGAQM